jgi:chromosome segregation ATPase
MREQMQELR